MSDTALRRPSILPFFNLYTLTGLLAIAYFALTIFLRMLWGETSGVEYLYLLMLIQAIPVVVAFSRRHFNYIAFIMVFHFFQLSLPKWFQFSQNTLLAQTSPEVIWAIQEWIFCTSAIILVYYAARHWLFSATAEKERFQLLTLTRVQVVLLMLYVVFVPFFLNYLPAWFLSVHFLLLSADLVLLFTSDSVGNRWLIWITKCAAFVGAVSHFLNTGMMTLMGALVLLGTVIVCLRKRFSFIPLIIAAVILMSAVQTVKGAYRMVIFEDRELSLTERAGVLWELLHAKYIEGDDVYDEDNLPDEGDLDNPQPKYDLAMNLISGFMRAGDDSLERVLPNTPSKVPFWGGETYASIPFMFIPRSLWPDKPTRHFWNKYGRLYGVLSEQDMQTSVGVSFIAEAYMNFGYHGMYICAILIGFLFALVERSAFYILHGYFYFPYIVLLTPLLAPGSDLGSMLNSLWVIYVVFLFGRPMLLSMARRDEYS